ncbi:MAG: cyclic nucleotide-binding domain-containing protein, partial [Leptospiraceae bacterium]|nr:cyclic nucleotide-binding domain-containing protein [Leptospiraceae bacterium]
DTLVAYTDCEVIKLTVDGFIDFMRSNSEVFKKFLSQNSEKLRTFLNNIESYRDSSVDDNSPEALFEIARKYIDIGNKEIGCFALKKYLTAKFQRERNAKYVNKAEELLNTTNSSYKFPEIEEFDDGFSYPKGTVIFVENEPDDYFYIISKGSVKISKIVDGADFVLEVITEGEIFGEMAILNGKLRSATAIANEDCKLLRLDKESLINNSNSAILTKLFILIAKRFWLASQRFYIKQIDDPNVKMYLQLQIILEEALFKSPPIKNRETIELKITLEQLQKMIGTVEYDRADIKEFITDPIIKISGSTITINDIEDFEFKTGVIQKKYQRLLKEVYL